MASEYGWSKREILEDVYLDELFLMSQEINKRKLSEYKMQLAISTNPHLNTKDQKGLWRLLEVGDKGTTTAEFDHAGFETLKAVMSGSDKIKVKS